MAGSDEPLGSDEPTLAGPSFAGNPGRREEHATRLTQLLRGEPGLARLGHYVILNKLGAGGMGVVFAAYDEVLDRKVAIKVLHDEGRGLDQRRLIREAQAMARLSHPNVVQIYESGRLEREGGSGEGDSGERDSGTFIVMEFVDGCTLAAWREQKKPSIAEILAVFGAAGRGLAAAHQKGLVHRDFKPDNVMIGEDGRVMVMDFGLARGEMPSHGEASPERITTIPSALGTTSELSIELTVAGALMGTPAYMAPEQFRGEATDAKTDQFSFCVALWEALYGERPFSASSLPELSLAVTGGQRQIPAGAEVPTWILRVLDRGLALAPSDRWPTMDALLDALAVDPTRRRRAWILGMSLLGFIAAAIVGSQIARERNEAELRRGCAEEAAAIEAVWSGERRAELAERFVSAKAASAWSYASVWMDEYAQGWAALREASCIETRVDHSRDEASFSQIVACLDDGRVAAEALVDVWRSSGDRAVMQAATAAAGLPPIDLCRNDAWLAQRAAPPSEPEIRERVGALRVDLGRAEALRLVGEYEEGLRQAQVVLDEAVLLGWEPLEVEARVAIGELEAELGRLSEARVSLERATLDAIGLAHDLVALRAAIKLTSLVGYVLSDHENGRHWQRLAAKLLRRMKLEDTLHDAALHSSLGDLQWSASEYDTALASYSIALEIDKRLLGPDHPEVGRQLSNIGYLHMERGEYELALDYYRRALTLYEATLGPDHPNVGDTLSFISDALRYMDQYEAALAASERSVAVLEAALGPDHSRVADAINNVGSSLSRLDRNDEALAAYQRALAITEAKLGTEHPQVGIVLNNIALCEMDRGDHAAAEAAFERVIEHWLATREPQHTHIALCRSNLAALYVIEHRYAEALEQLELAQTSLELALGPEHPHIARTLRLMGDAHAGLGQLEQARAEFERAEKILESNGPRDDLALVRFGLAKVLVQTGERERALALAELARQGLDGGERSERGKRDELAAWLAEQRNE